jgi:hypothetical protein
MDLKKSHFNLYEDQNRIFEKKNANLIKSNEFFGRLTCSKNPYFKRRT